MPVIYPATRPLSTTQVKALAQGVLDQALPQPAIEMPPPAALDGRVGSAPRFALEDHTHAVHVQRTVLTTNGSGLVTWTFARPIVCALGRLPPVIGIPEDTGTPVAVQITARAFTSDGVNDTHTSVTLRAQRSRTLPASLAVLSSLVNYDVFGVAASGVKLNLTAADPTQ